MRAVDCNETIGIGFIRTAWRAGGYPGGRAACRWRRCVEAGGAREVELVCRVRQGVQAAPNAGGPPAA